MLGQELVNIFEMEKDFEVVAWDKEDCDITNKDEIQGQVSSLHPDILINAAAYNLVDKAEEEPEKANLLNGSAVGFLAEIAEKMGILMVHYSSDYVFRGDKKDGYTEEDTPDPQSAYAKSKFLGEQELRNNCSKFYLIRLSRLFGKVGSGEMVKKSFVDSLIDLSSKPPLSPPISPRAKQGEIPPEADPPLAEEGAKELKVIDEELSSPTYAPDAARLTLQIIKKKMPFGVYHGANSGACTWYEFAVEIFKILSKSDIIIKPITSAEYPRPAIRPKDSILLNIKLPRQRSWQEALKEYLS